MKTKGRLDFLCCQYDSVHSKFKGFCSPSALNDFNFKGLNYLNFCNVCALKNYRPFSPV